MGMRVGLPLLLLKERGSFGKRAGKTYPVACEALSERMTTDPDYDKSKQYLNEYEGITSGKEFHKMITEEARTYSAEQIANGKRALRSDAVLGFALICKPPAEEINKFPEEKRRQFFKDSDEILNEIMGKNDVTGKDNIRAKALHGDEQGWHRHYLGTVYTKDGRICAKELINLKLFKRLNKEYPEKMRLRGWDIDDCIVYDTEATKDMSDDEKTEYKRQHIAKKKTKNHGRSSKQYKADKDKARLEQELIEARAEIAALRQQIPTPPKVEIDYYNLDDNDILKIGYENQIEAIAEIEKWIDYDTKNKERNTILDESEATHRASLQADTRAEQVNNEPDAQQEQPKHKATISSNNVADSNTDSDSDNDPATEFLLHTKPVETPPSKSTKTYKADVVSAFQESIDREVQRQKNTAESTDYSYPSA